MADKGALYNKFFGSDDDSELSDIEEDPPPRPASPAARARSSPSAEPEVDADPDPDDDDDDDAAGAGRKRRDGDDDYDAGDVGTLGKSYKKKKDKSSSGDGVARKKKKKKVRSAEAVEEGAEGDAEPEPELTPAQRERQQLSQKLDAAIKAPKPMRKRKRKADDDDISLQYDEEVAKLEMNMKHACLADREALAEGRPAINKLQMLNQVISTLQKAHLHEAITESSLLSIVKLWLEPGDVTTSYALPSISIQRSLVTLLSDLMLDTDTVKRNELGKIVNFYSKCKRVDPAIRREADKLVMGWMRPIIRRSASYRDRPVQVAEMIEEREAERRRVPVTGRSGAGAMGMSQSQSQSQTAGSQGAGTESNISRRHAMIPQAVTTSFTVAPRSKVVEEEARKVGGAGRFGHFKKKLQMSQSSARKL